MKYVVEFESRRFDQERQDWPKEIVCVEAPTAADAEVCGRAYARIEQKNYSAAEYDRWHLVGLRPLEPGECPECATKKPMLRRSAQGECIGCGRLPVESEASWRKRYGYA